MVGQSPGLWNRQLDAFSQHCGVAGSVDRLDDCRSTKSARSVRATSDCRYRRAIARALRATPITVLIHRSGVGVARWNIAGQSFVFVRGVTADSLDAGQASYFVYEVVREDSLRLIFSAPYREYSGRAPGSKEKESDLRACLFVRGSRELGYVVATARGARHFVQPALPRNGYYRWRAGHWSFVRVSDSDVELRSKCAATLAGR